MNKVFIVIQWEKYNYRIRAVFETKKLAEQYINDFPPLFEILEFEVLGDDYV